MDVFFNDRELAEKICKNAVEGNYVVEAKHSNLSIGVCCFYLNGDDIERHKKILNFFIANGLVRKTNTGRYYNISFKYNYQTRARQYGRDFHALIHFSDFFDLNTGEWIYDK